MDRYHRNGYMEVTDLWLQFVILIKVIFFLFFFFFISNHIALLFKSVSQVSQRIRNVNVSFFSLFSLLLCLSFSLYIYSYHNTLCLCIYLYHIYIYIYICLYFIYICIYIYIYMEDVSRKYFSSKYVVFFTVITLYIYI